MPDSGTCSKRKGVALSVGYGGKKKKKLSPKPVTVSLDDPKNEKEKLSQKGVVSDSRNCLKRERIPVFVGSLQNVVMFDVDDPRLELYPPDGEVWSKYRKQVKESGGFDIDDYPGPSIWAPIVPVNVTSPDRRDDLILAAKLALFYYNRAPTPKRDSRYEFSRVVKTNKKLAGGVWLYITFEATERGSRDNPSPAVKTFQALVWKEFPSMQLDVEFCRLKNEPQPPYSGDKVASEVHLPSSRVAGHCYT